MSRFLLCFRLRLSFFSFAARLADLPLRPAVSSSDSSKMSSNRPDNALHYLSVVTVVVVAPAPLAFAGAFAAAPAEAVVGHHSVQPPAAAPAVAAPAAATAAAAPSAAGAEQPSAAQNEADSASSPPPIVLVNSHSLQALLALVYQLHPPATSGLQDSARQLPSETMRLGDLPLWLVLGALASMDSTPVAFEAYYAPAQDAASFAASPLWLFVF